ncbi:haloacid dehalogenase type II [Candidatus Raskinella chloraquaticus]|uniref:Haloacid dehalogenase n=1 Tax=Candidatus Raskinella chloraquaticus TaxID=1951219 RepID=A0A1W9HYZ5_9HYPH|nr:MAG: haloacid dehalogenase [Proteobacteria bacterium SG_bin8]
MATVKALFFDVFGTLADWRGSIAREVKVVLGARADGLDGIAFAEAWRAEYQPSMERVRQGGRGYVLLDILHRENLERILPRFGLSDLSEETKADLNHIWHRLDGWADVRAGLARLSERFWLAPCSNGHIALMAGLARHNGWHWDAILGAEIARDYKPKPGVYLAAVAAFGLKPGECMMVAAHSYDLSSAAALGLRTAHIARPLEFGEGGKGEHAPSVPVDHAASDLVDLARRLHA